MSYELNPYTGGGAMVRDVRRTSRAISRVNGNGQIRQTQVDVETDLALGKIDSITASTGQALGSVAKVAQAEAALALQAPLASGRLAYLAERHLFAAGEVLDQLTSRLRRI
jgi:hypothetical protein